MRIRPSNLYFDGSFTARPSEHFTAGIEWSIGSLLDSEQYLFFEINRRHCSTSLSEIDPVIQRHGMQLFLHFQLL